MSILLKRRAKTSIDADKKRLTSPKKSDEETAAKALLDSSAKENRTLFIAFALFAATSIVIALGITDEELLLEQKLVTLPALSLPLPLWALAAFIPLLLLLLHFDLLHNAEQHYEKLKAWLRVTTADGARDVQLYPFILDFARVQYGETSTNTFKQYILAGATWMLYIGIPLLTFILYLWVFARLQEFFTTSFHILLLLADCLLLRKFSFKLSQTKLRSSAFRVGQWSMYGAFLAVALIPVGLWSAIMFLRFTENTQRDSVAKIYGEITYRLLHVRDFERLYFPGIRVFPRLVLESKTINDATDLDVKLRVALQRSTDSSDPNLFGILRNLSWRPTRVFQDRSLRFAKIRLCKFRNTKFENVDFHFSDLYAIDLSASEIIESRLIGADFTSALLESALIVESQALGARFDSATGRGFSMINTDCEYCGFRAAMLTESQFEFGSLLGSNFTNSVLTNTYFAENARATTFANSNLRGAFFVVVSESESVHSFEAADFTSAILDRSTVYDINKSKITSEHSSAVSRSLERATPGLPERIKSAKERLKKCAQKRADQQAEKESPSNCKGIELLARPFASDYDYSPAIAGLCFNAAGTTNILANFAKSRKSVPSALVNELRSNERCATLKQPISEFFLRIDPRATASPDTQNFGPPPKFKQ